MDYYGERPEDQKLVPNTQSMNTLLNVSQSPPFLYHFPAETYADGPLLGLLEIKDGGIRGPKSAVGGSST